MIVQLYIKENRDECYRISFSKTTFWAQKSVSSFTYGAQDL